MTPPAFFVVWFLLSAGLVAVVTPIVREFALKLGVIDRPGGVSYKWHQRPTPYLGGLGVIVAVAIPVAVYEVRDPGISRVGIMFVVSIACAVLGVWDDIRALSAALKLGITLVAGAIVWQAGIGTNFSESPIFDVLLTAFWIAAITHAFNIVDNMDGVAAGVAVMAALSYFGVAAANGQHFHAAIAVSVAGACAGFLPFNFLPASIFMGDLGTMFLGFFLGSIGLVLDVPAAGIPTRTVMAVMIMGVPLFNMLLVIVSRLRAGQRVTHGGTDGVAHRLVALGLTRGEAAVVFWMAGAALGTSAISISMLGPFAALVTGTCALTAAAAALWGFQKIERYDPKRHERYLVPAGLGTE